MPYKTWSGSALFAWITGLRVKWNDICKSPFGTIFSAYTQRQSTHKYYQCFDCTCIFVVSMSVIATVLLCLIILFSAPPFLCVSRKLCFAIVVLHVIFYIEALIGHQLILEFLWNKNNNNNNNNTHTHTNTHKHTHTHTVVTIRCKKANLYALI